MLYEILKAVFGIKETNLPCSIYGDRIVVNFLNPENDLNAIKKIIDLVEANLGKLINLNVLKKEICKEVVDEKQCRFVLKALSNHYSIAKVKPKNIVNLIDFYKKVNKLYGGFIPFGSFNKLIELKEKMGIPYSDLIASIFPLYSINRIEKPSANTLLGITNYYILRTAIAMAEKIIIDFRCTDQFPQIIKSIIYRAKRSRAYIDIKVVNNTLHCEILNPYYYLPAKLARFYGKRFATILAYSLTRYKPWSIKALLRIDGRDLLWKLDSDRPWAPILSLPYKAKKEIPLFDSIVESNIFNLLSEALSAYNCNILRESTVIDVAGSLFIPDITITCGNRDLYLEIIGFWSKRYIDKKRDKLRKLSNKIRSNIILLIDSKIWDEFKDVNLIKIPYEYNKMSSLKNKLEKELRNIIEK